MGCKFGVTSQVWSVVCGVNKDGKRVWMSEGGMGRCGTEMKKRYALLMECKYWSNKMGHKLLL